MFSTLSIHQSLLSSYARHAQRIYLCNEIFFSNKTCDRWSKLDNCLLLVVNLNFFKKKSPEKKFTPMQNVRDARPQWSQPIDMLCGKLFGLVGIEMLFLVCVCARERARIGTRHIQRLQQQQRRRHHHRNRRCCDIKERKPMTTGNDNEGERWTRKKVARSLASFRTRHFWDEQIYLRNKAMWLFFPQTND